MLFYGLIDSSSIFSHIIGIIYDVIVEPPSVGSMTDEHGHQRPVAFLAYRYVSSGGRSIQILSSSKSTNTTLYKCSITTKSPAIKVVFK